MRFLLFFLIVVSLFGCNQKNSNSIVVTEDQKIYSLFGELLESAPPSPKSLENLAVAERNLREDSTDIDNIIWLGRRVAYTGDYHEAINIYGHGIGLHPNNPRLYRHRGHRYISIREFDKAISDLSFAASLIAGKENQIEQDGLPNARNIPVSTLHGNIYYHLGLAHYLKQDFDQALRYFEQCKVTGKNPDNIVSSTHWIYMIQRRLGNNQEAVESLSDVTEDMDVIENMSYHNLCLLYKGLKSEAEISPTDSSPSSSAVNYGVANWYFYNGDSEQAIRLWKEMMEDKSWSAFGNIAAEAEIFHLDSHE